jgi:hypothetical protein
LNCKGNEANCPKADIVRKTDKAPVAARKQDENFIGEEDSALSGATPAIEARRLMIT